VIPGTPPCLQKHGAKTSDDQVKGGGLAIAGDSEHQNLKKAAAPEAAATDSAPEGNVAEQPPVAARGRQVLYT